MKVKEDIRCVAAHGSWVKNSVPKASLLTRTFSAQSPCGVWFADKGCPQIFSGSTLDYFWQESSSCGSKLRPFDRQTMCQMLHQKSDRGVDGVSFAGDSLTAAFEFSLKNAFLREGYDPNSSVPYSSARGCNSLQTNYCPGQTDGWELMVHSTRNDRNLFLAKKNGTSVIDVPWTYGDILKDVKSNFIEDPSLAMNFMNHPPALVILNRGAHYEPTPKVIRDLNGTLNFIFCQSPNTSVIFRGTVPGTATPEADFFRAPDITINNTWGKLETSYHFHEFMDQNKEVRSFLTAMFPQVIFLDVAPSTALRRDGHRDFLHYCVPGPIDHWVNLLYNALLVAQGAGMAQLRTPTTEPGIILSRAGQQRPSE